MGRNLACRTIVNPGPRLQTETPELNHPSNIPQVIPGCKPFTLRWQAVYEGTVSIEVIGGPTQGTQIPIATIASGIPNSGEFVWTPEASFGANAFTGYKIINDGSPTGEFTFSVPFSVDASTCDEASTPVAPVEPTVAPTASKDTSPNYPTETPIVVVPSTSSCTTTSTVYVNPPSGTGYPVVPAPVHNTTAPYPVVPGPTTLYPTATAPLPSGTGGASYPTSAPTPPAQEFPGAASSVKAGLGLAGAAAAFIFML